MIKITNKTNEEQIFKIINENFTIACSQNALQVLELKKEGKNKISSIEFLKGNKLEIGSNILANV